jgi:hypothetical protein
LFNQNFNIFVDIPGYPRDLFHGQWSLLIAWDLSNCHSMIGGLASPPESQFNSPNLSFGPTSTFQRGNFSPPKCVNPRDLQDTIEPPSPASEVKKPAKDDKDAKDARVADVPSRESSSHPRDDDRESVEDYSSRADVESGKPPLDMQENEHLSDLEDNANEVNNKNGLELSRSSEAMMVDDGPLSESKGAQPHLSDSEEDDDEEDQHANAVESFDSSVKGKIARPAFRIVEPNPQTISDSNQISADFESAVQLAAEFELRRSSRNIASKNRPTVSYADYIPPRKSFNSKRKVPFENHEVILKVSLPFFPLKLGE